jgi:hypothetical protein
VTLAQIDPGFFSVIGRGIGAILLYAVLGVLLMLLGFYAVDLTTPGKLNRMVRSGLPNAVVVTAAGMVSMAFIVVTAIYSASGVLLEGLLASLIFGLSASSPRSAACGCWSGSRASTSARCWPPSACSPRRTWSPPRTWHWASWWRWPSSEHRGRPPSGS